MSASAVIRCRDMGFRYDRRPILDRVNFEIPPGDFACIVGPNGSGKTTLLRLALGLLKPSQGSIEVFDQPAGRAVHRIGYVPQHPKLDPLFPINAIDVVLMGRLCHGPRMGFWRKEDRSKALEALEAVGMADRRDHHFASLSGGQKQRVLIARALSCKPQLLLLDEPTAGLDAHVEEGFYRLLEDLNSELTIVMVSHDLGFVSHFVKTVICVGREVHIHPTSAVTGQVIADLYGSDMRLVRHDHRCSEGGHECS